MDNTIKSLNKYIKPEVLRMPGSIASGDCYNGSSVSGNCLTGTGVSGDFCSTGYGVSQQDPNCLPGATASEICNTGSSASITI